MDTIKTNMNVAQQEYKAPKAVEKKEAAETKDGFEAGKTEEKGFFSKLKDLASNLTNPLAVTGDAFKAEGEKRNYNTEIGAAIAGGAVGAIVGGVISYNSAMAEVNKQPVESVALDWQKPVTQDKVIGKMPADYYEPNNIWSSFNNHGFVEVTREAPVMKNGVPEMQQVHKEFSDHGKIRVEWKEKEIGDPWLKGYSESRWEDGHNEVIGKDRNGNDITRYEIDGWNHRFTADVQYKKVGTYKEPEVTWETGVSVGLRTFEGIALGLGAGAVSVALATAAAKRALEKMKKS